MDATETADFYELIVERHHKTATVVTSNRDPSEWIALMSDPLLAQSAIDRLVAGPPDGLVFVGPLGGRLLRRNFRRIWAEAPNRAGLDATAVRFHDLLADRQPPRGDLRCQHQGADGPHGHSTMRAALTYRHATRDRDLGSHCRAGPAPMALR